MASGSDRQADGGVPLGTYLLPGRIVDPALAPLDASEAEELGLRTVWISERWDQKDASVLLGAVANATGRINLATGITHPNTRHPLLLAAMGATLQRLSRGRFILGLGRSAGGIWRGMGLAPPTTESLADTATILRALWAGETVSYDGPAGRFPSLRMGHPFGGAPPPLVLAAMGPRSLALAGESFDGVLLHPLLTTEAVARASDAVRSAAERAGRDPEAVRVYAAVIAAPDLPAETQAAIVGGRAITYLQAPAFGELIAGLNGWDPGVLTALRSHPLLTSARGGLADQSFTLETLGEVAAVLPDEWIRTGAAVGSTATCADRLTEYLRSGVDEVVLHGNRPGEVRHLVDVVRTSGALQSSRKETDGHPHTT